MQIQILLAYFFSGAAGLMYELLWIRLLGLELGNTMGIVSGVVSLFMAGLAIGSWCYKKWIPLFNRWLPNNNPLLLYAALELGICAIGAASPFLIRHAAWPSLIFLLFAAILMGLTFPAIADAANENKISVAMIYGVNTLGAALGIVLAGFWLPPVIGVTNTIILAAIFNAGAAIVAFNVTRKNAPIVAKTNTNPNPATSSHLNPWLASACFLAGASSLLQEVAWVRPLSMTLGSTNYALSLILLVYIASMALGALAAGKFPQTIKISASHIATLQIAASFSTVAGLLFFTRIPYFYSRWFPLIRESFWKVQLVRLGLSSTVLTLTSFLAGITLPWIIRANQDNDHYNNRSTAGPFYSISTLGGLIGSLVAGFIFIPKLGVETTLKIGLMISSASAILAMLSYPPTATRAMVASAGLAAGAIAFLLPPWDPSILISHASLQPLTPSESPKTWAQFRESLAGDTILLHRDGKTATVTVKDNPQGERTLLINGKPDASSRNDMATQLLSGYIPGLLHPKPNKALVLGLGSGVTTSALAQIPNIQSIATVEIEPLVAQAARYFENQNHRILQDSRLRLIFDDGRHYLSKTQNKFDLIVSETSNLWLAGNASLFSQEMFIAARRHLEPNGIFCQWIHAYRIDPRDFKIVLATFLKVFPGALLFKIDQGNYILVGTPDSWNIDISRMNQTISLSTFLRSDLASLGIDNSLVLMGRTFSLESQELVRYANDAPLNTDNMPILEFSAPKAIYMSHRTQIVTQLDALKTSDLPNETVAYPAQERTNADYFLLLGKGHLQGGNFKSAQLNFQRAANIDPNRAEAWLFLGQTLDAQDDFDHAAASYERAIALKPKMAQTYFNYGYMNFKKNYLEKAVPLFKKYIETNPGDPAAWSNLGIVYLRLNQMRLARESFEKTLAHPNLPEQDREEIHAMLELARER